MYINRSAKLTTSTLGEGEYNWNPKPVFNFRNYIMPRLVVTDFMSNVFITTLLRTF